MTQVQIEETVNFLKSKGFNHAPYAIILGTGLGKMVNEIKILACCNYKDIPHFPEATVEFHQGKLIYGELSGKKILAMQGRFHYYEGYSAQQITYPVRIFKYFGVKTLLVSNAAGAIHPEFRKGSLMLITDHINLLPDNPLSGKNNDECGPRFPDMSQPYAEQLIQKVKQIALQENIAINTGVYAAVPGPNLETAAEYRYLKIIGADAVGMSTVPEVIVARHMNMQCLAISVLTDECNPDDLQPADISDILHQASIAEPQLITLTKKMLSDLV